MRPVSVMGDTKPIWSEVKYVVGKPPLVKGQSGTFVLKKYIINTCVRCGVDMIYRGGLNSIWSKERAKVTIRDLWRLMLKNDWRTLRISERILIAFRGESKQAKASSTLKLLWTKDVTSLAHSEILTAYFRTRFVGAELDLAKFNKFNEF